MKIMHLIVMLFSLFTLGCNSDISKPKAINEKVIVTKEDIEEDSKITNEVEKEVNAIKTQLSNFDKSKILKETKLPLILKDYIGCNIGNTETFCKNRFPTYDIEDLPFNLKDSYIGITYIDNVFKLPSINNVEIYILARNMTDVEEYTIVTYNKKIIDKLLIGKSGSEDNSDRDFIINKNYENIEINLNDEIKSYRINSLGKISVL